MPLALWLSFDGGRFNLVQAWHLAVATALILTLGYFLYLTASDKVSQADTAQKFVNLQAQRAVTRRLVPGRMGRHLLTGRDAVPANQPVLQVSPDQQRQVPRSDVQPAAIEQQLPRDDSKRVEDEGSK